MKTNKRSNTNISERAITHARRAGRSFCLIFCYVDR